MFKNKTVHKIKFFEVLCKQVKMYGGGSMTDVESVHSSGDIIKVIGFCIILF